MIAFQRFSESSVCAVLLPLSILSDCSACSDRLRQWGRTNVWLVLRGTVRVTLPFLITSIKCGKH